MTRPINSSDTGHFNNWSRTYERSWTQPIFFDKVHRILLSLVEAGTDEGRPQSILDAGCGTGRLLRDAGGHWPHARLIGVDPADGMVNVARRMNPGATFQVGTAESLSLPDASVDVALSTISFHHWNDPAAGVREVARVLRPGGRFFLTDHSTPWPLSRILRHHRQPGAAELRRLFSQAGLRVETQGRMLMGFILFTVGRKARE